MVSKEQPLIFELSKPGRTSYSLPKDDVPDMNVEDVLLSNYIRTKNPNLPEVSELQLIRHFTALSLRNFGVDTGFYPLGSCTMKYNPKVHEDIARMPGFTHIHPYQVEEQIQGSLELMYGMQQYLCEITGMDEVTLQPAAGAQGEWTGLMMIRAYHEANGDISRTKVIIPDSAHGTNPASASVVGLEAVTVRTNDEGLVDIEHLKEVTGSDTAALMLTNPNTLGLFEENIVEIADIVHRTGGKLYYDGANSNAILGVSRPGDMGFDVVHLNLHKTFTGPHGGGGPGSGPVGVKQDLRRFLPTPLIVKKGSTFMWDQDHADSIGKVKPYYGNFSIIVRAYAYIRTMGASGLKKVSEDAVLNANYLMRRLEAYFDVPYDRHCKHEFVLSGKRQKLVGVKTIDIAKRLLDFNYHPPTIYFPTNVEECLMIEPTETEDKETLDEFAEAMIHIAHEAKENPDLVQSSPHTTVLKRLDETLAARNPILKHNVEKQEHSE
ncbi:glycine dehydrogenase subunit 2 [Salibacterium salarium]|uniref:Probable glycine dehydrogenase (decarboxylating) subunit 2 n=1 Tax=Salibacterium salarium TaxID=284579 RepID=A0A3R9PB87_9BACI|nr:aminomethyl-transferring glycine dehydrogenase subunit GcvPB [Salibacterium salarium]RSL34542.1 glycine dehydrogenase subunit 2 [Salibacterium salarium]